MMGWGGSIWFNGDAGRNTIYLILSSWQRTYNYKVSNLPFIYTTHSPFFMKAAESSI